MPAVDLPAKIACLCRLARIPLKVFPNDIGHQKILDHRTASRCLDPTASATVSSSSLPKLIKYFDMKLGMELGKLECGFETSPIAAFEAEVEKIMQDGAQTLALRLEDRLHEIRSAEADNLCGKYLLYRHSFSGSSQIVTEVAAISKVEDTHAYLAIEMYCHPTIYEKDVEWFRGKVFRFGRMYSAIVSYRSETLRRIRYLHFPVLDEPKMPRHHGLVTGYSSTHAEPVAARVFAEKISPEQTLTENDKARVRRGNPDDPQDLNAPAIPAYVRTLIENHIDDATAVLMSHKNHVPRP